MGELMLLLRMDGGLTYTLDRQIGSSGKHGHLRVSSVRQLLLSPPDYTPYRHAAISPAEPKVGAKAQIAICKPGAPEAEWMPLGEGVVAFDTDR